MTERPVANGYLGPCLCRSGDAQRVIDPANLPEQPSSCAATAALT
jgi:hypothetical protein